VLLRDERGVFNEETPGMELFNWEQIREEHVGALQTRKVIHTPKTTIVRLVSKSGVKVPWHQHPHEQVTILLAGCFRFEVDGKTAELRAGEVLRVPPDVPHEAEALEDSLTIEIFTPPREDWMEKSQETRQ
jgi:quercetin dioxygenase-like cupin family protein